MKNKKFGFTLIELLVVIVIIGILATISTATFKSYFGKARDAERQSAIQNMALMVKVEGADDWTDTKFYYADNNALKTLFTANDFRSPAPKNGRCYYYGFKANDGQGVLVPGLDGVGDNNEFFIAVDGEETATTYFADGTSAVLTALLGDGPGPGVDNIPAAWACQAPGALPDVPGAYADGNQNSVIFQVTP